ncbi:LTA synthase family protein [Paenibacillus thermoaerophilus]|uniref:LTA synthase family protein n=1 Tax=Paenibacillus thermoaerophilus TaxID=1215385 RepID=A0ABW2V2K3_9BACL|nr:LTA synthase family protein [Paenibacillus thermoaerophilus]TMV18816.1 LTA synthase family protein [Paenibacillus thermoaerophilus]
MRRLFRKWIAWRPYAVAAVVLFSLSFPHGRFAPGPAAAERVMPEPDAVTARIKTPEADRVRPNIVILLSEAFWDPTLLPGVRYNRDPIPFFRQLRESFTGGWMLTPQHGGGTANVEYEVLTGNPVRGYSEYEMMYGKHIDHPIDSIAWMASREGYRTTAISPFFHHHENSSRVYAYLGFSQFISMEFFPPDYSGPYLADRSVVRKIIEETQESPGPDLIFANTMENHYHFYPGKFEQPNPFRVEAKLPAASVGILETLAQGLSGADAALQELVGYFSQSGEPTLLLFFGDHQPALEKDYLIYRQTGYLSENDPEEWRKMYTTPFVIWDNYLPVEKKDLFVNSYLLLPELLDRAKLPQSEYTAFLKKFGEELPAVPRRPADAGLSPDDPRLKELEERLSHRLDELKGPAIDEMLASYVHGYPDLAITGAALEEKRGPSGEVTLTVTGNHFGLGCELLLNGKPLPTVWKPSIGPVDTPPKWKNDDGVLTAVLSAKQLKQSEQADLQVRVLDDKKNELYRSPVYKLSVQNGTSP